MFSKEEELEYEELKRKLAIYDAMNRIEMDRIAARDQELDDAEAKGREEGVEKIARNLLKVGCEIGMIIEATGLSKEQIDLIGVDLEKYRKQPNESWKLTHNDVQSS